MSPSASAAADNSVLAFLVSPKATLPLSCLRPTSRLFRTFPWFCWISHVLNVEPLGGLCSWEILFPPSPLRALPFLGLPLLVQSPGLACLRCPGLYFLMSVSRPLKLSNCQPEPCLFPPPTYRPAPSTITLSLQ